MRTHQAECTACTAEALDFVDITEQVQEAVTSSAIQDGQVTVFSRHSACSLIVNERETGLLQDIRQAVEELGSSNGLGASRARRALIGSTSIVLPLVTGKLRLGTWQRILLVELEGENDRSVIVQVVGE